MPSENAVIEANKVTLIKKRGDNMLGNGSINSCQGFPVVSRAADDGEGEGRAARIEDIMVFIFSQKGRTGSLTLDLTAVDGIKP